jgi:hypothetical protein
MLHLTLVNNLLSSIGSIPYFGRPNFPQHARYYPPGVQLSLLPFGHDTLQRFLFLERPEGMDLQDAPEFEVLAIPKPNLDIDTGQIVPETQEFATVGHLYRGIEQGFRHLVDKYGEQQVFIGPPRRKRRSSTLPGPNSSRSPIWPRRSKPSRRLSSREKVRAGIGTRHTMANSCRLLKNTASCKSRTRALSLRAPL